jgi:hypothetical protein
LEDSTFRDGNQLTTRIDWLLVIYIYVLFHLLWYYVVCFTLSDSEQALLIIYLYRYWSRYQEGRVGIPLTSLTPNMCVCVCVLSQVPDLQRHMSLFGRWVQARGDSSFCWYWWNCWSSLFKLPFICILVWYKEDAIIIISLKFNLTDFVCLYTYEFWLSLCKFVRSSVILLLPLFSSWYNWQIAHLALKSNQSLLYIALVVMIFKYLKNSRNL